MTGKKDYYAVLGVKKDCNEADLKKAYRKLAVKHHPDKGGDEARFKEVAEAYAILSDKDKRKVYDLLGAEAVQQGVTAEDAEKYARYGGGVGGSGGAGPSFSFGGRGGNSGGFEMPPGFAENLFASMFGGGGPGAAGGDGFTSFSFGGPDGGFEQFPRRKQRSTNGFSSFGGGFPQQQQHQGFYGENPQQQPEKKRKAIDKDFQVALEDIMTGITKKMKISRKLYDAASGQYVDSSEIVSLPIKAGMKEGCKFTFKEKGNEEPGYIPADLVFHLKVKPHDRFKREGDDLITTANITLKQALQGGHVIITGLAGEKIRVPFGTFSNSNTEQRIKEKGLPSRKGGHGDLVVKFNIQFPDSQTAKNLASAM